MCGYYSLHGSLAVTGGVGSDGGPGPTLFSARTRYKYCVSSTTSASVYAVSVDLPTLIQRVLSARHRSTWYPVTGVPPSLAGAAHVNLMDDFNASATASFSGTPGRSEDTQNAEHGDQ